MTTSVASRRRRDPFLSGLHLVHSDAAIGPGYRFTPQTAAELDAYGTRQDGPKVIVSAQMDWDTVRQIDDAVSRGWFRNRSEFLRVAAAVMLGQTPMGPANGRPGVR